ncbi:DUF6385 domain-containing protein [Sedimentibacter sp.]|uniref:DUF6385 domain-containing protein n=1 Tax=Sedimentibacter sp. TaxID=1960295 RepID=UPI0028A611FF|nr:DUF6385 domain-containing protein [Sedimentibacter sp.]
MYKPTNHRICTCDYCNKTNMNCCRLYPPAEQPCIVNNVIDYCSNSVINYSDWIDCASLNKYYYFIKNYGDSEVEVYIEISPNRCLVCKDSDQIIVRSSEVAYLQPLRESRYVRFSYRNLNSPVYNLITAYFQGKCGN